MSQQAQAVVQAQQKTSKISPSRSDFLQRAAVISSITPVHQGTLQRCSGGVECAECRQKREGTMQRAAISPAPVNAVPPIVHDVLSSSGQPLDAGTQAFMEPRFGHDFSQVRVHTDARAAESARSVNALAYTVGRNVVFGTGQYAPATSGGRKLLAHELVHVVQQKHFSDLRRFPLQIGTTNDTFECQADDVAESISRSHPAKPITTINQPFVQCDLARPPHGAPAPLRALTPGEVQAAIAFNQDRFGDPYSIRLIREVLGVPPLPAVVGEELIQAVVQWQAERHMTQDGKIGHITTRSIFLELVAEGELRDATFLLIDSYKLPESPKLNNIRVGTGASCCGTVASPADAVTSGGMGSGTPIEICVCRPNIPQTVANYDHFVRIIGHELTHVPQRAAAIPDPNLREFEALFWEICSVERAPQLSAVQRVAHANAAVNRFNLIPFALRTPALIAKRNQLNVLIANVGVGSC